MDNVSSFTVENPSKIAIKYFDLGNADALTAPLYKRTAGNLIATGNSKVYFNPSTAFSSAKQLYKVMGHELLHVSQIDKLAGQTSTFINSLRPMMEFHAYNYQSAIGAGTTGNSFSPTEIRGWMINNPEWYKNLSHTNFPWSLNFKYKYPF